jgi:hypothetical protein
MLAGSRVENWADVLELDSRADLGRPFGVVESDQIDAELEMIGLGQPGRAAERGPEWSRSPGRGCCFRRDRFAPLASEFA